MNTTAYRIQRADEERRENQMTQQEKLAVYLADAHQSERPVWQSSFGQGRRDYTIRWRVKVLILLAVVASALILL